MVQVACGENHSLAIAKRRKPNSKKQLYAWGDQKYSQCGQYSQSKDIELPTKIKFFETKEVEKVCAGRFHSLALTADNELFSWGLGDFGRLGIKSVDIKADP